jgi:hypothetical protein
MNFIKRSWPKILVTLVVSILLGWWAYSFYHQVHNPPDNVHPGDVVYFTQDSYKIVDGNLCQDSYTYIVAPVGPNGHNWYASDLGFGYVVYLIDPDGGRFLFPRNLSDLNFVKPKLCTPLKQ